MKTQNSIISIVAIATMAFALSITTAQAGGSIFSSASKKKTVPPPPAADTNAVQKSANPGGTVTVFLDPGQSTGAGPASHIKFCRATTNSPAGMVGGQRCLVDNRTEWDAIKVRFFRMEGKGAWNISVDAGEQKELLLLPGDYIAFIRVSGRAATAEKVVHVDSEPTEGDDATGEAYALILPLEPKPTNEK